MKNFDLKDFLIHLLHGGIILLTAGFVFTNCDILGYIVPDESSKFSEAALFLAASYLVGLMLDPIADCVDTLWIRFVNWPRFPSYFFLKNGKCCGLKLANHIQIRDILNEEATANDGKNRDGMWNDPREAKLLFNHAKSRAFAYGTPYQLGRIGSYFQLFVFYRNMIFTSVISLGMLACAADNLCCKLLIIVAIVVLGVFFYMASYKYRAYYCRMVLGAVYHNEKTLKEK